MNNIDKVLYTGKTHTTGGRDGAAHSDDGRLQIRLSPPGGNGEGTNPEQLFAAGWSACFIGAMGRAAKEKNIVLPPDVAVDAEVNLGSGEGGFFLQARLRISLPGLPREQGQALIEAAHQLCPYSRMSRGNIDVTLSLA
ncbi:organic hydroperoxide resistance protein [Janthinobacterium sp. PSPC3-1]|uniref:organic hydroperoxide resistance protein n=1 Tax=Janthinobacterium sp. PSPC3-1 TaxID=2804653 RepID=UPI003CE6ACFD